MSDDSEEKRRREREERLPEDFFHEIKPSYGIYGTSNFQATNHHNWHFEIYGISQP